MIKNGTIKKKEFYVSLEREIHQIIIDNKGYLEVYNQFRVPYQIHFVIEKALNILTNHENKKWCRNIPHRITLGLDAFIKSMELIPCQGMCNEVNLSKIIYENIEYQFNEILNLIPKLKCKKCNKIYKYMDSNEKCYFCNE